MKIQRERNRSLVSIRMSSCVFSKKIKIPEWKQENQKTLKISQKVFKLEGGGKVGVPTKGECK